MTAAHGDVHGPLLAAGERPSVRGVAAAATPNTRAAPAPRERATRDRHRRAGRHHVIDEQDIAVVDGHDGAQQRPHLALGQRTAGLRRPALTAEEPAAGQAEPSRDFARQQRGLIEPTLAGAAHARRHPGDDIDIRSRCHRERGHRGRERPEPAASVAVLQARDDGACSPLVGEHGFEAVDAVRHPKGTRRRHEIGGATRTDAPIGASAHRATSNQQHARP